MLLLACLLGGGLPLRPWRRCRLGLGPRLVEASTFCRTCQRCIRPRMSWPRRSGERRRWRRRRPRRRRRGKRRRLCRRECRRRLRWWRLLGRGSFGLDAMRRLCRRAHRPRLSWPRRSGNWRRWRQKLLRKGLRQRLLWLERRRCRLFGWRRRRPLWERRRCLRRGKGRRRRCNGKRRRCLVGVASYPGVLKIAPRRLESESIQMV